jgi:flagellar P-ring protein FlgI
MRRMILQPIQVRGCVWQWLPVLAVLLLWAILLPAKQVVAARIKDLASVQGVRPNQLVGFGLVVGLNGTGDGNKSAFTSQGLINMLEHMGVHVNPADVKVKNVAGVMITATLPPFVKAGQTIDVTISSIGDASSLQGGTLVTTPMKGMDGQVYAIAQGPLSIGGFDVAGPPTPGVQKNHLTVGRIPAGATVEREVALNFNERRAITLSLNQQDFTTVSRMVEAINQGLGGELAKAVDGATVEVKVPEDFVKNEVGLLSRIESMEVEVDSSARVVLDERTGTVVMGENVRLKQLALSHGKLSLRIGPGAAAAGAAQVGLAGQDNRVVTLDEGASLGELVRALNSVGVTPRDMIAIFQSIKASGALMAELVIL